MSRRSWILRSVGYSYVRGLCKCTKESSKLAFDRSNSLVESTWVLVVMFVVEVTKKLTFKLQIVSAQTFNVTQDDYQKIVNGGKRYSRAQIRAGTISW